MPSFLIIRLSSIGDVILTTPLVRCLRKKFPGCSITYVVKKEFAAVLAQNPQIDRMIQFDKSKGFGEIIRLRKLIRNEGFTHILDLQNNIRSLLISRFGPGRVTSFSKKLFKRFMLIRLHINSYGEPKPVYLRYFEAVSKLGVQYDGLGTEVFPHELEILDVRKLISGNEILKGKKLLAVAPGAHWKNKRWPAEKFAETVNQICLKGNYAVVMIGSKADEEICHRVMQQLEVMSVSMAGKLSLMGSAALLQQCSLLLTNDTGMMHMAQAVATPVVAVFGPTTRELGFFPLEHKSRVAEVPLYCRPCTAKGLDTCPKQHFRCMLDIRPETVAALATELENAS